MINLTATLGAGLLLLFIVFVLLYRFTPLTGKQSGVVAGLVTNIAYLPFPLLHWPGADVVTIHFAIYTVAAYLFAIITVQREAMRRDGLVANSGKWFHWGPAAIVIFFLVIIAVDTVFVTLAVNGIPKGIEKELLPSALAAKAAQTEFPGIVHDHYYQKETAFNDYLERVAAQRRRGWQVRKGWLTAHPAAGQNLTFQVAVADKAGRPIVGATVQGRFLRASDSRFDRPFQMHEVGNGLYRVSVVLPKPGMWGLQLQVRKGKLVHELRATTSLYDRAVAAAH
jgi:nitrogen fixation protein FixH